eukprot:Skav206016  [mRNA]  locus=scaffold3015:60467:60766:+ [translate_table: standard]
MWTRVTSEFHQRHLSHFTLASKWLWCRNHLQSQTLRLLRVLFPFNSSCAYRGPSHCKDVALWCLLHQPRLLWTMPPLGPWQKIRRSANRSIPSSADTDG